MQVRFRAGEKIKTSCNNANDKSKTSTDKKFTRSQRFIYFCEFFLCKRRAEHGKN
nr:MAG TPA: hypothetical protein [Bacteriophage sp.]